MSGLAETATEAAADELGDAASEDQANFFSEKLVEVIPQCNEIEGERDLNGELLGEEAPRTDEGDVNNVGCSSAAESLPQEEVLKSDRKSVRDSEMRSAGKSGRSVEARYGVRDDGDGEWSELGSEVTSELRSKAKSGRRSERRQGGADEFELSESDVDAHGENFFDSSRRSDRQPSSGAPEEEEETEEQIIIRLQKELREFEAYEKEMQPNLNIYEDIIELRREAEQLEDDRKRALLQIDLGDISSYYDGDVEREVEELEAAVENSYLQACWTKERQRYIARNETDLPEWWRVDIMKLGFRLREAKRRDGPS
ncbi:uncharacterized protein TEOVI_000556400 [Trypanosoma equiperdum]|uniref:Uncharacterized protein n=1 Tax=Trypanosoma equiperdum TaxID=5694 RepID=A0A1G4I7K4_TRYEQ|nr:hypothetical protein, conserved [Trypanosoma equiperdum]